MIKIEKYIQREHPIKNSEDYKIAYNIVEVLELKGTIMVSPIHKKNFRSYLTRLGYSREKEFITRKVIDKFINVTRIK